MSVGGQPLRHRGRDSRSVVRLARPVESTRVLGPGHRALVVVQGCELRCRGCVAPGTHELAGGEEVAVVDLVARLLSLNGVEGVTFSGGEPFLQAAALTATVDLLRASRVGASTMSFSGYRLEWLRERGTQAQRDLLSRLDLLVDGPYVERLHAPLRWRGSRNQRIHLLSRRHRAELEGAADVSAGLELNVDEALGATWIGVPPIPGFLSRIGGPASESGAGEKSDGGS